MPMTGMSAPSSRFPARPCGGGSAQPRQWLACRPHHLGHLPALGEVALVAVRSRWMAADLPPFVILAFLRYVANWWPATRRMSR